MKQIVVLLNLLLIAINARLMELSVLDVLKVNISATKKIFARTPAKNVYLYSNNNSCF